jgi:elongation factor P
MGMISTNEFRKRAKLLIDGEPWMIVDNDFIKPGKGQAFNRVKLKNLLSGRVVDRTFKSGESVEEADVTSAQMQYLFHAGETWTFMDTKSYEQIEVPEDQMGDAAKWLLENTECDISMWNGRVISVTPPIFMDLIVTYTEPAVKGDTATNVTKKATLETGAEVDVPPFIEQGMKLRIDTRTGEYVQRSTD